MKTIKLYRWRNILVNVLFVACCLLIVAYLVTEDWKDPNWTLMASVALNAIFVSYQKFRYRNLTLELFEDQIVFRPLNSREKQKIEVSGTSEFSKDWKGIYVRNEKQVDKIPLEYMGRKEGNQLFSEIKGFYDAQ
ncbi:MAG: hypothetical protein R3252_03575 [Robiginitalea sp.]|nr:hypothetical protein [Robiginitalea sp.]